MTTTHLLSQIQNTPGLALEEITSGYPVLCVENTHGSAKIALHGAHLYDWTPQKQAPVLYTSPTALFEPGTPIRGGIPICWPWFNAHPTDSTLPSHGLVRSRLWDLTSISQSSEQTVLTFAIKAREDTLALWPHLFSTTATMTIGKELSLSVHTVNEDEQEFVVGGALHTYLRVGAVQEITIRGVENTSYLDTVGESVLRRSSGPLTIQGEVDRIYHPHSGPVTVEDPTLKRTLSITREGSRSVVIWNPWIEKASHLKDLPNDHYRQFVCVEAANALEDVYVLQPGQSHTLSTTLRVVPH